MVPAAVVDGTLHELASKLDVGDIVIDGGNSYYIDDIRRAKELSAKGIHYVDLRHQRRRLGARTRLLPDDRRRNGHREASRSDLQDARARPRQHRSHSRPRKTRRHRRKGYLHCGPSGAGHFVKMVHNGIEYGLMAAYAEGLNILRHANVGKQQQETDAETTPLRNPEHYMYDFNLADISEVWRRGSVIASWLLDLTAISFTEQPNLDKYSGRVSDSGEGRWTILAGIESVLRHPY